MISLWLCEYKVESGLFILVEEIVGGVHTIALPTTGGVQHLATRGDIPSIVCFLK